MNIAYYYEFRGLDNVLNRVEILTANSVTPKEVTGTGTPFTLKYTDVDKLEPVQGSGATIGIVSHEIFEFVSLHTDDMQGYMIKMYRAGKLYWIGWLDPELYEEQLSDYPPYPVEFTGADFNVLERLKYKDANDNNYTDIVSMMEHLKRCLSALDLPFGKVYIGCSTTAEGITISDGETVLDKLYVMSANFYDEDNEPMSCREVIESILQPFGLMMVQRDGNIYIYDYNTVDGGLSMKCYNYANWAYEGLQTPEHNHGDLSNIGFVSTGGSYGFEEMKNNVTITSSIYAQIVQQNAKVDEESVSESFTPDFTPQSSTSYYQKCKGIENLQSDGFFVIYNDRNPASYVGKIDSLAGSFSDYTPTPNYIKPLFRVKYPAYVMAIEKPSGRSKSPYYINLKVEAYPSTLEQPLLMDREIKVDNSGVLKVFCNWYYVDDKGKIVAYYNNTNEGTFGWNYISSNSELVQGRCVLWFSTDKTDESIVDQWTTNADIGRPMDDLEDHTRLNSKFVGSGLYLEPDICGFPIFEITNKIQLLNPVSKKLADAEKIKMVLFNNFSISILDVNLESPSTDDYEFKSYVNKKVKSDLGEITLKCISANEEKAPIGKANILKKFDSGFTFQLSYTRSGQTNILERLLMCTIHSNYSQKHGQFGCTLHLKGNPVMGYVTYTKFLQGKYLVTGAELDFRRATMQLSCVGFSKDDAKLSDIPYE